jgi:hypothetical protein
LNVDNKVGYQSSKRKDTKCIQTYMTEYSYVESKKTAYFIEIFSIIVVSRGLVELGVVGGVVCSY